jgi:hypothetical protein
LFAVCFQVLLQRSSCSSLRTATSVGLFYKKGGYSFKVFSLLHSYTLLFYVFQ